MLPHHWQQTSAPDVSHLSRPVSPKRPWRCPICYGVGTVDHDFYTKLGYSTSTERMTCKACGGEGIVIA